MNERRWEGRQKGKNEGGWGVGGGAEMEEGRKKREEGKTTGTTNVHQLSEGPY